jgi:hypothetical protein
VHQEGGGHEPCHNPRYASSHSNSRRQHRLWMAATLTMSEQEGTVSEKHAAIDQPPSI